MTSRRWILACVTVIAVGLAAAPQGAARASQPAQLVGTWSGGWDGGGASGGFELTVEQAKDGTVTGKVAVTGEPAYTATFKSLSFDGIKLTAKYDFTPDPAAEVELAGSLDKQTLTGTWSLHAQGTTSELASGTWKVTKK